MEDTAPATQAGTVKELHFDSLLSRSDVLGGLVVNVSRAYE